MIRGTTPVLEFELPFDVTELSELYVSIAQNRRIVIDASLSRCRADEKIISLQLTQAETLALKHGIDCEIQIRCRTKDGSALASEMFRTSTDRILKDGEI